MMSKKKKRRIQSAERRQESSERNGWLSVSGAGEPPMLPISATAGRREKRFDMHWVIGRGWIHTHGMAERGYPEIEVRGVPLAY